MSQPGPHEPVLLEQTLELLAPVPGATFVDGTLGPGGHAEALLERIGPDGRLFGIDRDPRAIAFARRRLARYGDSFVPLEGNHESLRELLASAGVFAVDGVLLDLGLSSMQLDDASRGFSFRTDGPLDMRMSQDQQVTAADLLEQASREDLTRIIRRWGEERHAAAIARQIVRAREKGPLTRTQELAELVERTLGAGSRRYRIHPATRTFQALRIQVNHEVQGLADLLADAVALLRSGGRLAVIAYHSLEDRAVKQAFKSLAGRCTCPPRLPVCACGKEELIRILTPKPARPGDEEIERNPRARSARLRVAERL